MPRNIAILVQDETMANQGFLQAFAQQGNEVTCVVCNDLLPVALQMAKPDFAIVNGNAWHEAGDAQELLDSMGIPYLGAGAATIRRCRDAAQLSCIIEEALAQGSIDAGKVEQLTLAPSVQSALLQTGQLGNIVANTFAPGETLTLRADGAEFLNPGVAVRDQKELSEALIAFKDAGKRAVVRPQIKGVELIVCIMGDLSDILILPPIEVKGALDDSSMWQVPMDMQSLADDEQDAQAIRSEVERCALDAFLACGCRDFACVRLVWDGGCARVLDVDAAPSLSQGSPIMAALTTADINLAELACEFCEIADETLL